MPTRRPLPSLLAALLLATGLVPTSPAQVGAVASFQKISGAEGDFFGALSDEDEFAYSMCSIGDLDGDGVTDLAVGAPWDDDGGLDRGAVWIVFLQANGKVKGFQKISDLAGGFSGVLNDEDWFGWSVAAIGDVNHDGVVDLGVGAIQTDDLALDAGAAWIVFLKTDGTVLANQKISGSTGGLGPVLVDFSWFGSSVAPLGDINGDGQVDIAIGSHGDSDTGVFVGAVYALFLNPNGTVKAVTKINESQGGFGGILDDGDEFGWALAPLGDLDGNGVGDLAVSAELDDDGGQDRGAVWVLFLQNAADVVLSEQKISDSVGGFGGVLDDKDHFGRSLGALGDIDADGSGDLCVGAFQDDDGGMDKGAVWNLLLNADGTVASQQKISALEGGFTGALDLDDKFGGSAAGLGDLNGDGVADLAVGASNDDDGGFDSGAVWVLFLSGGNWTNLGFALAGASGPPVLSGTGTLAPSSPGSLNLSNANPSSLAMLFAALASNPVPFKGGMLVPVPSVVELVFLTTPGGTIPLSFTWPVGVPSGTTVVVQYAIEDAGALKGVALSNALQGTTP